MAKWKTETEAPPEGEDTAVESLLGLFELCQLYEQGEAQACGCVGVGLQAGSRLLRVPARIGRALGSFVLLQP